MNLYEIDGRIAGILESSDDGEITEQQMQELLKLQEDEAFKAENTAKYLKNLMAESAAIKAEIDALTARRKVKENAVANIKKYLLNFLKIKDVKKYETATFTMRLHPSDKFVIDDEEVLTRFAKSNDLIKVEEKLMVAELKAKAKTEPVPGGHIEKNESLVIK